MVGGKLTGLGENRITGPVDAALVAVPTSVTECGLPAALSIKVKVAWRWPTADGVRVSATVQEAPGAMAAPTQLLAGGLKSAGLLPPKTIDEIFRIAFPVLVTVKLTGELVEPCA